MFFFYFNTGKIEFISFNCSNNYSTINVKTEESPGCKGLTMFLLKKKDFSK